MNKSNYVIFFYLSMNREETNNLKNSCILNSGTENLVIYSRDYTELKLQILIILKTGNDMYR